MPSNTAAWLLALGAKLEVKSSTYTPPGDTEIVIRNRAMAVNPSDSLVQDTAYGLRSHYPTILGSDIAGEVAEVGSSVSDFNIGDRVLAHATKATENETSGGGFQEYTVVLASVASKIPSTLSYASASVLPLGLSTAACGLFQKGYLALEFPSVPPRSSTGKTLLVWGGASSIGSNGIQLGVAAGYEVITTASPKNFVYVKKLGASQAFDYNSTDIVDQLVRAFEGKTFAGALHCAGSDEACFDVVDKIPNGNKLIASAVLPMSGKERIDIADKISKGNKLQTSAVVPMSGKMPSGVNAVFIIGSSLKDNEVGKAIYGDFLPTALADGQYFAAPDPWIIGKGLESVQAGVDAVRKGVSAKKVVITL